jgi:hypothetical protein
MYYCYIAGLPVDLAMHAVFARSIGWGISGEGDKDRFAGNVKIGTTAFDEESLFTSRVADIPNISTDLVLGLVPFSYTFELSRIHSGHLFFL